MDQPSPHPLWLGRDGEGRDYRRVVGAGIRALVHLAEEETPDRPPRKLTYCRIPLVEGSGNPSVLLDLAVSTVADLLRLRVPTLLYGDGGISRIPTIAAVALSLNFGATPSISSGGFPGPVRLARTGGELQRGRPGESF